jgi:hypothetical protein
MGFLRRFRRPSRSNEPLDIPHDEGLVDALAGVLHEDGCQPSASQNWARYLIYGHKRQCECPPRERIPDGAKPYMCYRCSGYIILGATPATDATPTT